MENAFYATKVTFCNQFYQLAKDMDVSYDKLRETWLLDPRISRDHTFVYDDNRGYGGSCLPKDMAAIIYQGKEIKTDVSFLESVSESNNKFIKLNV
jgi:UDPglucose 6-dehydrogenase